MNDPSLPLAENLDFLERMYARFISDPLSLAPEWRQWISQQLSGTEPSVMAAALDWQLAVKVLSLVQAYRTRGFLEARLDPLGVVPPRCQCLECRDHGLAEQDFSMPVPPGMMAGSGTLTLGELVARLRAVYCGPLGVEYMHIGLPERRRWLEERLELAGGEQRLTREERRWLLERLIVTSELERFIDGKYAGTRRFSLEGGESLVPLLERVLERLSEQGAEEVVLGMAHRGRLNVLVNVMGMPPAELFSEFEDFDPMSTMGSGDVKYHIGYSSEWRGEHGRLHLSLTSNPSHLEAIDPVVMGRVRAKQKRRNDDERRRVFGVLIHGDAAFAGQGIVAESLNLTGVHGYRTGGTIHIIVNNQIGFTTAPGMARSSCSASDVAKTIQVPIFHANGDEPEAVLRAVDLAIGYRMAFATDVVIDLVCFRRHGHNEIDEPSFTQPLLYERIRDHAPVFQLYGGRLVEEGIVTTSEITRRAEENRERLVAALALARGAARRPSPQTMSGVWQPYQGDLDEAVDTAVDRATLEEIARRLTEVPEGFRAHAKITRLLGQRASMGRGERPLDWSMGEALAFGSLLWQGVFVRMSGQDTRRGTFSQRHAVLVDVVDGGEYTPLAQLRQGQADFRIYDSPLSEAAVLGFEFGFSLDWPDGLIIWEAQFGDFANGAQVIIDQLIAASHARWARLSGLVLALPHGYEGQGPEHSSARLERFLQLAVDDALQICAPTTPAQLFHLLRRQALARWRRPLVLLTPKSMLRLPAAASGLEELAHGRFIDVLDDPAAVEPARIRRVLLCSGKIYYDLTAERRRLGDEQTAIVRLEQLAPLPTRALQHVLKRYVQAEELAWIQEEPANMGALQMIETALRRSTSDLHLRLVSRPAAPSPATGSFAAHRLEQKALIDRAFNGVASAEER